MTVAVVGLGLIGGSLGLALRQSGFKVIGVGRRPDRLRRARALRACHDWTTDPAEAARAADVAVICTPVQTILSLARRMAAANPRLVITDAGSTKTWLCRTIRDPRFVGGHPIAGSEKNGIEAARRDLFRGAVCVLTPTARTSPAAVSAIARLWRRVGMRVLTMTPERHDAALAGTSHLPHVLATALVHTLAGHGGRGQALPVRDLGAGSLRDMTRIAAADPVQWVQICLTNRRDILRHTAAFRAALSRFETSLRSGNAGALQSWFSVARLTRPRLVNVDTHG